MAGARRTRHNGRAAFCVIAFGSVSACSLFVSVDGLSDGAADAGSTPDAAGTDGGITDAGSDVVVREAAADGHVAVPPAFRVLTMVDNTAGNSMTIARAAQIQPGDLMVALVYGYGFDSTSNAPDSSWESVNGFSDPGPSYQVFFWWKIATASEPTSYTFVRGGSGHAEVDLIAYSGVSATNPFDQANSITYENVVSYGTPSLTTSFPNDLVVVSAVADGQPSAMWSAPASVTPRKSTGWVFLGDIAQSTAATFAPLSIACNIGGGASSGGVGIAALTAQ